MSSFDLSSFIHDLQNSIKGDVRFDSVSQSVYSVDASIFEVRPLGVAVPKDRDDLIRTVQVAAKHRVPIIPRGAGTGLTGACIGSGLIIDLSKSLKKILHIDYENEWALCEPGVVQSQLNEALSLQGYRLGPDTSTGNRATLGGMLGNNSAGANSLRYGKMCDHVESIELILSNGEVLQFEELDPSLWKEKCLENSTEGNIYRIAAQIARDYKEEILKRFPKIPRRVSGYNLDELLDPSKINLSKLIAGSEGTLGIVSQMKVKICKKPPYTALVVLHFHDVLESLQHVTSLLNFHPFGLEIVDGEVIRMGKVSPSMRGKLDWLKQEPESLLILQFDAEEESLLTDKLQSFEQWAATQHIGYARPCIRSVEEMAHVWEFRKSGLGLLMSRRSHSKAIAFIEDLSVHPNKIAGFIKRLKQYLKEQGKQAGMYGHAGAGLIHLRPYVDLKKPEETQKLVEMMEAVTDMVLEFGGSLTGEHGDGLLRSWLHEKFFGKKICQAFEKIKTAFDPTSTMNPGKIVHSKLPLQNLRAQQEKESLPFSTMLDFSSEGGFSFAVNMCNGNGQCRKPSSLMCPSFHASTDEWQTTRARAQALRHATNPGAFTNHDLYRVLDHCLECKGCKTECPSQVDMAKMKAEFLYHYQKKHGTPLRNHLFARIDKLNPMASLFPSLSNFFLERPLSRSLLSWLGLSEKRSLPSFAPKRFSSLVKSRNYLRSSKRKVVFFNDCFNEFNTPEIGLQSLHILELLGFDVIIPPWTCCGRPMISKGFLPQAKKQAESLSQLLLSFAEQGLPIIGLEPSCILTCQDDLFSLLPKESTKRISASCMTIDQFLASLIARKEFSLPFSLQKRQVKLHTHCHQKALVGSAPSLSVLRAVPGFTVSEIDSGCCGMAGSFGYEKEHYEMSMQIGSQRLFPAIQASSPGTVFIANGMSCRCQIQHGTQAKAQHLVEALTSSLLCN